MTPSFPILQPAGDAAVLVTFGERLSAALNARAHALAARLAAEPLPGYIECVPGYAGLLVRYDPLAVDYPTAAAWVSRRLHDPSAAQPAPTAGQLHEIPVLYGGQFGPDLPGLAAAHRLDPAEVIRRHTSGDYSVFLIGFTPGFPYLGGLDPSLATPRLAQPRTRVPAGSVGIAGEQTGIYSLASPGGWQIIGRTPLRLFDPLRQPPFLLAPGDRVRFVAVPEAEFGDD